MTAIPTNVLFLSPADATVLEAAMCAAPVEANIVVVLDGPAKVTAEAHTEARLDTLTGRNGAVRNVRTTTTAKRAFSRLSDGQRHPVTTRKVTV